MRVLYFLCATSADGSIHLFGKMNHVCHQNKWGVYPIAQSTKSSDSGAEFISRDGGIKSFRGAWPYGIQTQHETSLGRPVATIQGRFATALAAKVEVARAIGASVGTTGCDVGFGDTGPCTDA